MKKIKIFIILLASLQFNSCIENTEKLLFDEILYAEYKIGVLSYYNVDFNTGEKTKSMVSEEINDMGIKKPYLTSISPNQIFIPLKVMKINENGELIYFSHYNADSLDNGYYSFRLPNSSIIYFNSLLSKINSKTVEPVYYEEHLGMVYHGSYYYLSFLKGNKIIHTNIYYLNDASKETKRFIEYIECFIAKSKFNQINKKNLFEKEFQTIFDYDMKLSPFEKILRGSSEFLPPRME